MRLWGGRSVARSRYSPCGASWIAVQLPASPVRAVCAVVDDGAAAARCQFRPQMVSMLATPISTVNRFIPTERNLWWF